MGVISKKFCPNCGSENVDLIAGGTIGMWMCKNCGYNGSVFPEKPIAGRELKTFDKDLKVSGNKKKRKKTRTNI